MTARMAFATAALQASMLAGGGAFAATIERDTASAYCSLRLMGTVENGDRARLEAAITAHPASAPVNLCLNSPGGSYQEALRVADFLLGADRAIRTIVDRDAECYSACALIFMAGHTAPPDMEPERKLHVRGALGFHAPAVKGREGEYDATVAARAHKEGLKAASQLLRINADRMEILPESLIAALLRRGRHEFLVVDTVERAGLWNIDLFGYDKPERMTKAMLLRACDHRLDWSFERSEEETLEQPVATGQGRTRIVLPDFGDEGAFVCVADIYRDASSRLYLDLIIADDVDDKKVPAPSALERKASDRTDPLAVSGTPLWQTLPLTMKLTDIPAEADDGKTVP